MSIKNFAIFFAKCTCKPVITTSQPVITTSRIVGLSLQLQLISCNMFGSKHSPGHRGVPDPPPWPLSYPTAPA